MQIVKRNKLQRLWLRLKLAFRLISKRHVILMYVEEDAIVQMLRDETVTTIKYCYAGMMEYQVGVIIKTAAKHISDIDIALSKAEFEAEVEIKISQKNKHKK